MRYSTKGKIINDDNPIYNDTGTYYESHYACGICSYKFSVISEEKPTGKGRCPGCPKCKEFSTPKGTSTTKGKLKTKKQLDEAGERMAKTGSMPAQVGKSRLYKAHDATMQMVMEDYGLTDINDKPYEGENCVPKLPPHLEKQVNEGFGASFGDMPKLAGNIDPAKISSVGMSQINSGKFRDQGDVVAMQQKYGAKPKYNFVNE